MIYKKEAVVPFREADSDKQSEIMKRIGNLYQHICSMENLRLADEKARRGKRHTYGVKVHDRHREANLQNLRHLLLDGSYRTSEYAVFTIVETKEREVYRLPYYPDRITHHAIMNILEPYFVASFTADTYSSIKGRGLHPASKKLKRDLLRPDSTYCLKIDVRKFYPSVDHEILKAQLLRKFKDQKLLRLLYEIIDSAPGVPIGNLLSQYLANFYLTPFDHWIKEQKRVRSYFRYADDIVILGPDKKYLHQLLADIREYFATRLKLQIKDNYQVFPVSARGIDFLGYVFRPGYTRLRPSIKKNFSRKLAKGASTQTIASYKGWLKHCDSKHLSNKLLKTGAV